MGLPLVSAAVERSVVDLHNHLNVGAFSKDPFTKL